MDAPYLVSCVTFAGPEPPLRWRVTSRDPRVLGPAIKAALRRRGVSVPSQAIVRVLADERVVEVFTPAPAPAPATIRIDQDLMDQLAA